MKAKTVIAAALLLFVGISVVVLVGREVRRPATDPASATLPAVREDALVVYYFHGNMRCPTCRNIESYSHEAVATAFQDELAQDKVQWRVVNYELPDNQHFAKEFKLVAPTVVLVRRKGGEVSDWRNLGRVWEFVDDRQALMSYVQEESRLLLGT